MRARMHGERGTPSLIPVLVTGIQQRRVCDANKSFRPEDSGRLDPCDKHRDEGRGQRGVTL
jgi:hypothetical protein